MRWNKRLLSALLLVMMLVTTVLPGAAAAELSATYEKASYYDIATTAYSRMLLFQNGVTVAASEKDKYGLIDATGAVKVPFQYDYLESTGGGYFIVTQDGQHGIMDSTGKMVYPLADGYVSMQNGIICLTDANWNNTYLTADLKPSSESAYYGEGGGSSVEVPGYYWVEELAPGYYRGYGENGEAILDENYNLVLSLSDYSYTTLVGVYNGMPYLQATSLDYESSHLIDCTGKEIVPAGKYTYMGGINPSGLIAVSTWTFDDNWEKVSCVSTLYDVTGKQVKTWNDREVTTETYFRDLAFTLDGQKYGTMDASGKVIIPNQYDLLTTAGDLGKIVVGNQDPEDEWSYIMGMYTADGAQILDVKYHEIKSLGGDSFRVCDGSHYGITDGDGKFVVPLAYSQLRVYCRDFIEAVNDQGGSKVINVKNEEIIPQSLEELYVYKDYHNFDYNYYDYTYRTVDYDGYEGTIQPFRVKTSSGYETYYVDFTTGESLGSLPVLASNITSDGRFVYRDNATGLYGYGQLTAGSFANPYAPASGAGSTPSGGGTVTPTEQVAYTTTSSILVDGKEVKFDAYALKDANGNLTNYLKLRDVAYILNGSQAQFNVDWDSAAGAIVIQTKTAYTTSNGSEMSAPFTGDQPYRKNPSTVLVDGVETGFDAITLTDSANNGYTYFKVRDLGQYLGFEVTWDGARGAVVIDTTKPYSGT